MRKFVINSVGLSAFLISLLLSGPVVAAAGPEIEMVLVKGGCFLMGCPAGDGISDEQPPHEVCLNDYFLGKFEVTQAQWKAVMGNNPSRGNDCGDYCPVESVTWVNVQEFIKRLNALTGKNYRLPTEAEWEYAAREGGKQKKWAGATNMKEVEEYAWFQDNAGLKSHPVGKKKNNLLGLYDMSGNVWEWVNDWYGKEYYKESPKSNPCGPQQGNGMKVIRGGSWDSSLDQMSTTLRARYPAEEPGPLGRVGFRLAISDL